MARTTRVCVALSAACLSGERHTIRNEQRRGRKKTQPRGRKHAPLHTSTRVADGLPLFLRLGTNHPAGQKGERAPLSPNPQPRSSPSSPLPRVKHLLTLQNRASFSCSCADSSLGHVALVRLMRLKKVPRNHSNSSTRQQPHALRWPGNRGLDRRENAEISGSLRSSSIGGSSGDRHSHSPFAQDFRGDAVCADRDQLLLRDSHTHQPAVLATELWLGLRGLTRGRIPLRWRLLQHPDPLSFACFLNV